MGRMLRNRRYAEASILFSMMDLELLSFQAKHGVLASEECEAMAWGEEELLKLDEVSVDLKAELPGDSALHALSPDLCQQLHLFYIREDDVYARLWESFIREFVPQMSAHDVQCLDITGNEEAGWEFTAQAVAVLRQNWCSWRPEVALPEEEKGLIKEWGALVLSYKAVSVAGVLFAEGDWFMARPNECNGDFTPIPNAAEGLPKFGPPKQMWAGKIKRIMQHSRFSGDGHPLDEVILEVQWHVTRSAEHGGPYSIAYQSPMVLAAMHSTECPFFPARSVLPIKFTAMRALGIPRGQPACLVLIRRQWHSLAAVNLPVPWPSPS